MRLRFGFGLDGFEAAAAPGELGSLTCGPLGLLDILETRLGLKAKRVSPAKRILEFKTVLEERAGTANTFYSDSLGKDPLAAAATLLRWRDHLIEGGWEGSASADDSRRLQDLAAVEPEARTRLAPGLPDRLAAVLQALDSRSAQIESLTVFEERDHLPTLWSRLCDKLAAIYSPPAASLRGQTATPGTDLAAIQTVLADPKAGTPRKLHLRHDGSLLCLTAHSEVALAKAVAQRLTHARRTGTTTLLAGDDAGLLDGALLAQDEAALGLAPRSRARPIPQVLLLSLRLRWEPLDPRALLEFVTHPVCPVTRILRERLATSVTNSPGVGGPEWSKAIEQAREAGRNQPDPAAQAEALRRIERDLAVWLLSKRFDPVEGASGGALSECCASVARWAASSGAAAGADTSEREQFMTLASFASELADLLRPLPLVNRAQLEHFLREVTANGWVDVATPAELEHVHRVSDPAGLIEPVDTVVWWDFNEPPAKPRLPWTEGELRQLAAHGARFPSRELLASQANSTWLRPVLAARKRLILATPRQRADEPVPRHPLHSRLLALIEEASAALLTHDVDGDLAAGRASQPASFTTVSYRSLPQLRRWWKLPSGRHLAGRDLESFSSLEKFIYSPYAWVLQHKAHLRAGPLSNLRLQPDSKLKGTLLHRLLDLVLAAPTAEIDWRTAIQPLLSSWLEGRWQTLLEQEGANLLLPGRIADGAALLESGKAALWELFQQMRAAGVTTAASNVALPATPFFGGNLGGIVDLVVESESARAGVIDLKLGGRETREKELADNRQLQLAVYGYLLARQRGGWPEGAFFILGSRRMLAQTNRYLLNARVVAPGTSSIGLQSCWSDFERVWHWRRRQLDAGWIEVTAEGADPEDRAPGVPEPVPPLPLWQATEEHAKYNAFDALTGWRTDA